MLNANLAVQMKNVNEIYSAIFYANSVFIEPTDIHVPFVLRRIKPTESLLYTYRVNNLNTILLPINQCHNAINERFVRGEQTVC